MVSSVVRFSLLLLASSGPASASASTPMTFDWAQVPGSDATNPTPRRSAAIAPDGAGGVITAGQVFANATFGSTSLTLKGERDMYVTRIDSAGVVQWAIGIGGQPGLRDQVSPRGIAADGSGGVVITGSFYGVVAFGSYTLTSSQHNTFMSSIGNQGYVAAMFTIHVTGAGTVSWAYGGMESSSGNGDAVAYDPSSGGVFVIGGAGDGYGGNGATQPVVLGSISFPVSTRTGYETFVCLISSAGTFTWCKLSHVTLRSIVADGAGGAIVAGDLRGGPYMLGTSELTSGGMDDTVVAHVTSEGFSWVAQAGGSGCTGNCHSHSITPSEAASTGYSTNVYSSGLASDGEGGAYLVGSLGGNASFGSTDLYQDPSQGTTTYVARISSAGIFDWVIQAHGEDSDAARGVAYDGEGGALVTGVFGGNATFGSTELSSTGGNNGYVMRVSGTGAIDWAMQFGGPATDEGHKIFVGGSGSAYLSGVFGKSGSQTAATFGSSVLHASINREAFVARLISGGASAPAAAPAPPPPAAASTGLASQVAVEAGGHIRIRNGGLLDIGVQVPA